ncbi:MarR family transcriptional regulator [Jatrophihabitans telluris]|uniref:MarR family transcriptional regulator n=1 Tax=Jatrophihabitans telluris TaxID=2038343 RepID=A0ABY4QX14_9ACTN|nr:MarR family transcriptional regulator [Jatrophihabitans telluris]UQX88028.1 MarR family transcriptional regulator [Jatrophihabitans telluris]
MADPIVVDDFLCLALYRASRAMTAAYRPLLEALGLTYPQYLVMALLWESGPQSVGQIGRRLSLDSSTLSPLLKRLEGLDLLSRQRSAVDERSVEIALTASGAALRRKATGIPDAICAATGLGLNQLNELVGELRELASQLEP